MRALEAGAAAFGLALGANELRLLGEYAAELDRWNRRINLVSCRTPGELVERHLLDSLAAARFVEGRAAEAADLGSGAGLPGIPLAIVAGGRWTLVEPKRRRASFLRSAVRHLGLQDVVVLEERVEELAERGRRWMLVTARGVWEPKTVLEIAAQVLEPRGLAIAFVGRHGVVEETWQRFRLVGRVELCGGARRVEAYQLEEGGCFT